MVDVETRTGEVSSNELLLWRLQVYTVGPSGARLLMWTAAGDHGDQWTYALVVLSNPAPFRVTFQAEVGGDMWTDIAVDDVSYTPECMDGGRAHFYTCTTSIRIYKVCA